MAIGYSFDCFYQTPLIRCALLTDSGASFLRSMGFEELHNFLVVFFLRQAQRCVAVLFFGINVRAFIDEQFCDPQCRDICGSASRST